MTRRANPLPPSPPTLAGRAAGSVNPAAGGAGTPAPDGAIVQAFGDRVLVRRVEPVAQTAGGIRLLEDQLAPTHLAVVVAVGAGRRLRSGERDTPPVKPGDTVLLHLLAGRRSQVSTVIESGGEECEFVHQRDILGIVLGDARLVVTLARA